MPSSNGESGQNPEPKATGGIVSVFKNLTSSKSTKSPLAPPVSAPAVSNVPTAGLVLRSRLQQGALDSNTLGSEPDYELRCGKLERGHSIHERIAAAQTLKWAVADYPLSSVTGVFYYGKDLINPSHPVEARVAGFELLTAIAQKEQSTDFERRQYFDTLTAPLSPDDFHLQLAALIELTRHGKNMQGFHHKIFPLLTRWLHTTFDATLMARKQSRGKRGALGEETNLSNMFAFLGDSIKWSFNVSAEEETVTLIDETNAICLKTTVKSDILACVGILDALVIYASIPDSKLEDCVKMLCSIHVLVPEAKEKAWKTISNLCKSHNGQTSIRILLKILRKANHPTAAVSLREVRGSISVLEKLMHKNGRKGYPVVPFTPLIDGLSRAVTLQKPKVERDILKLIHTILDDEGAGPSETVMEEDWSAMFGVAKQCSRRVVESENGERKDRDFLTLSSSGSKESDPDSLPLPTALDQLIVCVESLLYSEKLILIQKDACMSFLASVHNRLPESAANLVVEHYIETRICYPSEPAWETNVRFMLDAFFDDDAWPTELRLRALRAVTDVYEVLQLKGDSGELVDSVFQLVSSILNRIDNAKDVTILGELVSLAVSVADEGDQAAFDYVIERFRGNIANHVTHSHLASPSTTRSGFFDLSQSISSVSSLPAASDCSPPNVVMKGLVQVFMRAMDKSTYKAMRAFEELLFAVGSNAGETDARITALKLLFRLRCDWANRIYLTPYTESEGLAASLYRTAESLAKKKAEDEVAQQNRASRVEESNAARITRSTSFGHVHPSNLRLSSARPVSGVGRALQKQNQMWLSPDPEALPEFVSDKASAFLVSSLSDCETPSASVSPHRKELNISGWVEVVKGLLQQGCDWEVYSYILVHLPSQLSNRGLFKAAVPQIKELKAMLCEQIREGTFQEPPVSSGLRKADLAICLFQSLTMMISYHQHFTPVEDDDLVRTFVHGIGGWERSAKSCIHALSICCHEMPRAMGRYLVQALQRMSQIITQSYVAVHILEFLAGLSRLPGLYVNFREDEYRTVLAICFRYLQYVRDQPTKEVNHRHSQQSNRQASSTELVKYDSTAAKAPDDLPQYVYALTYHVITFWFLSLRLSDRAAQVSWIIKNLVSLDSTGRERIDEQAQVTIDFMQRVAYADVDDSAADPSFTPENYGEILKKRWLVGLSIVTIEQATRGRWAQITRRQPSGTSCYMIQERFSRPPPHQISNYTDPMRDANHSESNAVLPSHLLLQIASPPASAEGTQPIALPDDEMVRRAIRTFDRNSTVDGHKVGVIYLGEGQKEEVDILSNVMGSDDYMEFLTGLGTLTKLKGATFNTQGLDREYNTDGEYTFCWRDRVTEIVFHVTTQMPTNLDHDPQCIGKKRHIGNDFVNIIFNNSGLPFRFDTFPSEFNYVNIVITPESRASFVATRLRSKTYQDSAYYRVQVMSKPGFPEISPAAETKIISLKALPNFIRLLALNASVFSHVWANRAGGEHISSWRNRLREIVRLREKYGTNKSSTGNNPTSPPNSAQSAHSNNQEPTSAAPRNVRDSLTNLRRASVAIFPGNEIGSPRNSVVSTAETEVGLGGEASLVTQLDFSGWA